MTDGDRFADSDAIQIPIPSRRKPFLCTSLFFFRLAERIGIAIPRQFIGLQIALTVLGIFIHATVIYGAMNGFLLLAISCSVGTAFELIGLKTGRLFGQYTYSQDIGPKMFGLPIFIPLMWVVISYMSLSTITLILSSSNFSPASAPLLFIIMASILLTSWDSMADPLAVSEGGWKWKNGGKFHDIPLTNFIGWFACGLVIFSASFALIHQVEFEPVAKGFEFLPAFGYCLFSLVFARACLEKNMRVPAGIGFTISFVGFSFWAIVVF